MTHGNQENQGSVSALGDSSASRGGGRQGARGNALRQPGQLDSQERGQPGGASGNRFADKILEYMEVIDDNASHIGTVDHVEGDRIRLTRSDSDNGQHQYVLLSQVAVIEGNRVRLRERGDNDFGMES